MVGQEFDVKLIELERLWELPMQLMNLQHNLEVEFIFFEGFQHVSLYQVEKLQENGSK